MVRAAGVFGPHQRKQWECKRESQGAVRPHAVYPQTRAPLRARGKPGLCQKLIKPWWLLTAISQQHTARRGLPVVRSGASSCPLMHINCAHKSWWMVSLCSGSVFVQVWAGDVRKQNQDAGDGGPRESWDGPDNWAKSIGGFPSATPSDQARVPAIGGTFLKNHVLTYSYIKKSVYGLLSPGE